MANQLSSHLYDLIYSLSSSERRYFKLYIKNHLGKQNELSVKLFDLIVKSERKPIEKTEKKITFTKHPSRLKNYLYDLILKNLESYHAKTSVAIKIRKQINQIENLYNKALYDQCATLAKKALKEAEKIDNQNFKVDIISWHINALKQLEHANSNSLITKLQTQLQEAINKLKLEKEFNKLSQSVFELTKKLGTLRSEENENKLREIIDNPFLSDYSMANSFSSKSSYNSIYSGYYSYLDDRKKVNYFTKQNLLLYEDFPARKNSDQFNYITQLNNYALSCSSLRDYEKADYYFSKMESIEPNTIQIEVKVFEFIAANRLDLYLRSGQLKNALTLVDDIQNGLTRYGKKVAKTITTKEVNYLIEVQKSGLEHYYSLAIPVTAVETLDKILEEIDDEQVIEISLDDNLYSIGKYESFEEVIAARKKFIEDEIYDVFIMAQITDSRIEDEDANNLALSIQNVVNELAAK